MVPQAAVVTAPGGSLEERRAALMARAQAQRDALAVRLEPLDRIDRTLERWSGVTSRIPGWAVGTGLGIAALMLARPGRRFPLIRGGIAVVQFALSVRKLLSRR